MKYFGFALADSMFAQAGNCLISRRTLTPEEVKAMADNGELTPCLNPSHVPTIAAMRERFSIEVEVPEKAPIVTLKPEDGVVVMGVRGLPRLDATRHEYTEKEIGEATFSFSEYDLLTRDQAANALGFADADAAWSASMYQ